MISLDSNQHLYVQYWRHQNPAEYSAGGTTTGSRRCSAYDGTTRRFTIPDADGVPDVPTSARRPDGAYEHDARRQLYGDVLESDVEHGHAVVPALLRLPTHRAAAADQTSAQPQRAAQNGGWTPTTPLVDGTTYYWQRKAQDSAGDPSDWSTPKLHRRHDAARSADASSRRAVGGRVNAQLSATFVDSDSTDSGYVEFQVCSDTLCTSPVPSGNSSTVVGGTSVSWTPTGLTGAPPTGYYWRLRGARRRRQRIRLERDPRSFTYDTNPPPTPAVVSPADGASLGPGSMLTATFANGDAGDSGKINFQVCTTSACTTVVASGSSASGLLTGQNGSWSLSGVTDGSYYWRAQAQDAAGNTSTTPTQWSAARSFTLDATPPIVTPTSPDSGLNSNHIPTLTATYSDTHPDSLTYRVCPTSACSSVTPPRRFSGLASSATESWTPALADGTYYWQVRGTDSFGNASDWSAARSFRFDGTPPAIPVLQNADGIRVQPAPALTARVNDPGDSDDVITSPHRGLQRLRLLQHPRARLLGLGAGRWDHRVAGTGHR